MGSALVVLRRARNLISALFFLIAFSFAPAYAKEKANGASDFLFWLLTELRLYTVGELTHMRSMCVGVAETGVEHRSPAKNHTFKKTTEN